MQLIYKIEDKDVWENALKQGKYSGAPIDIQDGFIHFSTGSQVRETAQKHFTGKENLVLATIDAEQLGDRLKWEVSRGNALFPHYYGELDMSVVLETTDMPLDENGIHVIDEKIC